MKKMRLVASSESVGVYCPEDGRFSFFNSPYPAHRSFAGIDVYPKGTFGSTIASPVRGYVTKIRKIKCPHPRGFQGSDYDFVVLLRSEENPERCVKILHAQPCVTVGDYVDVGTGLGTLLRSGFFDFWTDPHVHLEVRNPSDPLRARGGLELARLASIGDSEATGSELSGIVVESKREYSLVAPKNKPSHGIPVDVDGQAGLLDAGIPHYGWFGVHTKSVPSVGATVRLCSREIGTVDSVHNDMCVARCSSPVFLCKGKAVGLSFYLYPSSSPLVKIIPNRLDQLLLKRYEEVSVVIS